MHQSAKCQCFGIAKMSNMEKTKSCKKAVSQGAFNAGDIVICGPNGQHYGDKFTVLEDHCGLTLKCHKTGELCIMNNREDYDYFITPLPPLP